MAAIEAECGAWRCVLAGFYVSAHARTTGAVFVHRRSRRVHLNPPILCSRLPRVRKRRGAVVMCVSRSVEREVPRAASNQCRCMNGGYELYCHVSTLSPVNLYKARTHATYFFSQGFFCPLQVYTGADPISKNFKVMNTTKVIGALKTYKKQVRSKLAMQYRLGAAPLVVHFCVNRVSCTYPEPSRGGAGSCVPRHPHC